MLKWGSILFDVSEILNKFVMCDSGSKKSLVCVSYTSISVSI